MSLVRTQRTKFHSTLFILISLQINASPHLKTNILTDYDMARGRPCRFQTRLYLSRLHFQR